jgi:ubiquinone/menaquinone biosynthesis C-methylase UbiE
VVREAGVGPGETVLDLGCGTGILTRVLAERGLRVVGVDPNEDMLAQARVAGTSGIDYRRGDADETGLPDQSVALVTAAQAFHWLDLDGALEEIHRILRPAGHAAALWNIRGEGPFMAAYDALLRRFSSEYRILKSWESTLEQLRRHPRVLSARERWETHAQLFDLEGLRSRAWSSSYIFRGVRDRQGFDTALDRLYEAHARHGLVEFPYRTVGLVFEVSGSRG